eukprot:1378775-Pyramimonas_sp.AAC.1
MAERANIFHRAAMNGARASQKSFLHVARYEATAVGAAPAGEPGHQYDDETINKGLHQSSGTDAACGAPDGYQQSQHHATSTEVVTGINNVTEPPDDDGGRRQLVDDLTRCRLADQLRYSFMKPPPGFASALNGDMLAHLRLLYCLRECRRTMSAHHMLHLTPYMTPTRVLH